MHIFESGNYKVNTSRNSRIKHMFSTIFGKPSENLSWAIILKKGFFINIFLKVRTIRSRGVLKVCFPFQSPVNCWYTFISKHLQPFQMSQWPICVCSLLLKPFKMLILWQAEKLIWYSSPSPQHELETHWKEAKVHLGSDLAC